MSVSAHARRPPPSADAASRPARRGAPEGEGAAPTGALGGAGPAVALPVQRCAACEEEREPASDLSAVQRAEGNPAGGTPSASSAGGGRAQQVAARGVREASAPLPQQGRIQAAFGRHDVSNVRAQVGGPAGPAARRLGARAYTTGERIGFREAPDLRLAAHEAAHVVQQRQGVHLKGGLSEAGDPYERQADRAADAVVAGRSAEPILDEHPTTGRAQPGVQRCACGGTCAACRGEEDEPVQRKLAVTASREHEPAPAEAGGPAEPAGTASEEGAEVEQAEPGEGADESALDADDAGGEPSGEGEGASPAGEPACASPGTATCYTEPAEEPAEEPETQPADPPATRAQEQVGSDSPDAEESDDCPIETAVEAQAEAGAPEGGVAEAAGLPPESAAGGGGAASGAEPDAEAPAAGPDEASEEATSTTAGEVAGAFSPLEAQISQSEGARAEAVGAYTAASARLATAGDGAAGLVSGVTFATETGGVGEAAARLARSRGQSFFEGAAATMEAVRARALDEVPARLGGLAEAVKAGIATAVAAEKAAISARIAAARGRALSEAASARQQVHAGYAATVATIHAETAAALAALPAAHAGALGAIDTRETSGLATVNALYAASRTAHEAKGTLVGGEATAKGQGYVAQYEGCKIHRRDSFWAGRLTDRRAEAQQNAAREVAKGFRDSFVDTATRQAGEAMKGRKKDRCGVIAAARQARASLDSQLVGLLAAVTGGHEAALAGATSARDGLLLQVDGGLAATLAALAEQERTQRQAANDTGYLQQVAVEQAAHAAAASVQQAVAGALEGLEGGLAQIRTTLAALPTPDPAALGRVLGDAQAAIGEALESLQAQVEAGTAQAEGGLLATHAGALAALAGVTETNDEHAAAVEEGFAYSMGALAAGAATTFTTQATAYAAQTQQLTSQGEAGFQQAVTGFDQTVTAATASVETALQDSEQRLEDGLRAELPKLDCEIPKQADKAAAQEAPAWKTVVAVLLIIAIIVVVALVIGPAVIGAVGAAASALGAGAAAGTIGTLVGGAIVGAAASAAIQVVNNWRTNQALGAGVGKAALMGAVGGFLGAGAGLLIGKAFSVAAAQALSQGTRTALQFAANVASDAILEVGTQLVTTGTFSWEAFGMALAMSIATAGMGELRGAQQIQRGAMFRGARLTARGTGSRRAAAHAEGFRPPAGPEPSAPRTSDGPEPAAPRPGDAEAPSRPRTEAEPEAPARRGTSEEEPRPPREVEGEATERVRVGDEEHGVTPRKIGERTELWACSAACAPVTAKLEGMIADLPPGHPLRTQLEALQARVRDIEARMAAGESNVDVVRAASEVATTLRDLGAQHARLGADLNDSHLPPQSGAEGAPRLEPPNHLRALDADVSDLRTIPVDDFRQLPIRDGDQAVYVLRDTASGAVLKVGIAENHPGRFTQYRNAGNKLGLRLELEVAVVQPRGGKTIRDVETGLRSRMEAEGHVMPWDNSGGRLGRPDRGTPFVHPSDPNLMWDAHGNLVQKGSGAPPPAPAARKRDEVTDRETFARLLQDLGVRGTANHLGVSESSVYRWRQEWGLSP
jgi:hypothetical protein